VNDRNVIEWFTLGMWKFRGLREGVERGRCPLCEAEENQSHVLLRCREMKRWRKQCFNKKMAANK
jgi:hypothetical protein